MHARPWEIIMVREIRSSRAGREAFLSVIKVMPASLRKWSDPSV